MDPPPARSATGSLVGGRLRVLRIPGPPTRTPVRKPWIRGAIQEAGGPDVYELVPAFFLSLLATVVFSLLVPRTQGASRR